MTRDRDDGDATVATTARDSTDGSSDRPSLETFERAASDERFELAGELGRGGMGRVVAATDLALRRAVAIKQVLSDDADDLRRFEREVQITAQLEHPAIVPIHEAGIAPDGRPYYVMRRIDGEPLSARLERTPDVRARLALVPNLLAIVDAAAFAHARQIIHRDIKPGNILLGAYGETLLIDWGLARRLDEPADAASTGTSASGDTPLTRAGGLYGTVGYMPPEQARGEPLDARADVYALGATLFHVLAGRGPFEGMSAQERIARAVLGDDLAPSTVFDPAVPPERVAIVTKAMASDRARRYRDAGELAADLRAFLAGQLVAAHRYTTAERLRRFVRRHRVAVAAVGLALAVAFASGTLAIVRVVAARDEAEAARHRAETERRLAADKADTMLLDRASTLARTDPAHAIAMLRQRSPTLPATRARAIAAVAVASGIPHGTSRHDRLTTALALSPDHRTLASADDGGKLVLSDTATGTSEELATLGAGVHWLGWIEGGKRLAVAAPDGGFAIYDRASHAHAVIDRSATIDSSWLAAPDRIRYLDSASHELRETGTTGDVRVLARGVAFARGQADRVVFHDGTRLHARSGDHAVELGAADTAPLFVRFSPTQPLAAAAFRDGVVEYSLDDGRQTHRWPIGPVTAIEYRDDGAVIVAKLTGELVGLYDTPRPLAPPRPYPAMWSAQSKWGAVFLFQTGELAIVDVAGTHERTLDEGRLRVLGAAEDSTIVAAGSVDGLVRWWDLTDSLPPAVALPDRARFQAWDGREIYVSNTFELARIDRRTQASQRIAREPELAATMAVANLRERVLVLSGPNFLRLVDVATGRMLRLAGKPDPVIDPERGVLLYARDRELHEIGVDLVDRVVRELPQPRTRFASIGRWFALAVPGVGLVREDRVTHARSVLSIPDPDMFAVVESGALWYTRGSTIAWWDGVTSRVLGSLGSPVSSATSVGDRAIIGCEDGSLWLVDAATRKNITARGQFRNGALAFTGIVALRDERGLTVVDALAGEQTVRRFPGLVDLAVLRDHSRDVLVLVANKYLYEFRDPVPDDPAQLAPWLAGATNAALDAETDKLVWR
ncbi:MAG TPA: serine/threonine-protein kinase [Kofleriaceae bacterium]|nr:serine/threonine-protein kinase [Kofleriaceae bacterium]